MKSKNPYVVGDTVRIKQDIRDAYNEVWHTKGSEEVVTYLAEDGEGLMFGSNLGIHYSEVEMVKPAPRCKCCGQVLPRKD
jgi:hypothetical protein